MKNLFYSLAIFGFIGLAYSSCPKLEPVGDYNDHDLLQSWVLLANTDKTDPNFMKLTCEDMYGFKEGSTYHLTGAGIDVATNKKIANWTENGEQKDTPGHFYFINPRYGNFYLAVIGKTTHSVTLYSCEFPFNGTPFVWIYYSNKSKFEDVPQDEKKAITDGLVQNGIKVDSLKFHDNSHC